MSITSSEQNGALPADSIHRLFNAPAPIPVIEPTAIVNIWVVGIGG